jgi:hypothetical protein
VGGGRRKSTQLLLLVNREVILGLCERRGLDVETIEVYLDSNKTPLPLLTSDTSWLSGRTLRIRGKRFCTLQYSRQCKVD